jgi:hypothetical protein
MIVDIDKAGFGSGNDGLETLNNLPGVQLDKDENVVLRKCSNYDRWQTFGANW